MSVLRSQPIAEQGARAWRERFVENAVANVRLEGLEPSPKALEIWQRYIEGEVSIEHLQGIHRYLFQDVYEWAGDFRTVDIAKGNSYFAHVPYIESTLKGLFWGIVRGATSSWLKSRAVCQSLGTDSRNTERRACFSRRKWKSAARIRARARVQEQLLD